MTRVLITSIGASPAIDVARSLALDRSLHLIGADAGEWGRRVGERLCAEVIELPRADDAELFVTALEQATTNVDFVFLGLDVEIEAVATVGRSLQVPNAFPPVHILQTIIDKAATEREARATGHFPATHIVREDRDNLGYLDYPIWLRPTVGSSGQAATRADDERQARAWLDYWREATTSWMAQAFLPGRNFNVSCLFNRGELIAWAAMERLAYLLENVAPSGVTGQVRLCETVNDKHPREVALEVLYALDPKPHGLYSVDLREDERGVPKVTEINPRLAGRPWLYTQAGVNLPLAAVRVLTGGEPGDALDPSGLRPKRQYRLIDMEPLFEDSS